MLHRSARADEAPDFNLDLDMQGAIFRGLYQNPSQWTPSYKCPTDCEWPGAYTVLGFAGACENVTVSTLETKQCVGNGSVELQNCTMTTPHGIGLSTTYFATVYETLSILNATASKQTKNILDPQVNEPEIAKYAFYSAEIYDYPNTQEAVWECSLNFTAWKYSEITSDSIANALKIGNIERIPLEPGYIDKNRTNMIFNQSGLPEFSVYSQDLGALRAFLESTLFTGSILSGESRPKPQTGSNLAFLHKNVSEVTIRLARSMTDALQQGNTSRKHEGSYHQAVTFVRVRWVWLLLLVGLEAAASILLIATMIRARSKEDVLLWKASQTALLFSHIDADGLLVAPRYGLKELEEKAETTTTQISKG